MSFFVPKTKAVIDGRQKDLTDSLAGPDYNNETLSNQRGLVVDLFHVPTGESVVFKAFLTTYSDQYNSSWEQTEVFGRMDPIQTFKNTKRIISLRWDVVASSVEEAIMNLDKCQRLFSMLYPVYEEDDPNIPASTTMVASPLFKLKFANLIRSVGNNNFDAQEEREKFNQLLADTGPAGLFQPGDASFIEEELAKDRATLRELLQGGSALDSDEVTQLQENIDTLEKNLDKARLAELAERNLSGLENDNFRSVGNSAAKFDGLVGSISGFTYEPDIDVGFFSDGTGGELYPQTIKLACEFTVMHTHKLGWEKNEKRTPLFPYGSPFGGDR